MDRPIRNAVMDHLYDRRQLGFGSIGCDTINFVWENTVDDSPLRKFIIDDVLINNSKTGIPRDYADKLCNQFLMDLCNRQFAFKQSYVREIRLDNAKEHCYHEQAHDEKCSCQKD